MKNLTCNEFEASASLRDTEYFGIPSAKVRLKRPCMHHDLQSKLLEFMCDFEFITIINEGNDQHNNQWLGESTKAFLTDVNLQLCKNAIVEAYNDTGNAIITEKCPKDDQIISIAKTSFSFSRFINDPYLPKESAAGVYADIVKNSFGKSGWYFVSIKDIDIIVGFLLFSVDETTSTSTIKLIATANGYHGRGFGNAMINKMEIYVAQHGIQKIRVGTQANNLNATQFYINHGFTCVKVNSIYHYWPLRPKS